MSKKVCDLVIEIVGIVTVVIVTVVIVTVVIVTVVIVTVVIVKSFSKQLKYIENRREFQRAAFCDSCDVL